MGEPERGEPYRSAGPSGPAFPLRPILGILAQTRGDVGMGRMAFVFNVVSTLLLAAVAYLLGRAILGLFIATDSPNIVWRVLIVATEPILRVTRPLTPGFMIEPLRPIVAAGWLLLLWFVLREVTAGLGLSPSGGQPVG